MRGLCQSRDAAEFLDRGCDSLIIGCHDHGIDATRFGRASVDVLDHRTTGNVGKRLPGESRRAESGRDDNDSAEGRRSQEWIEKRNRGHVE
jgi:hypothetical protein